MASDLNCDVIADFHDLAALEAPWRALAAECSSTGPFMEWEWLVSWWRAYGGTSQLRVLTAHKEGRLVGVLPMYARTERVLQFWPLEVARVVGDGGDTTLDYLEPLLHPSCEVEALGALMTELQQMALDVDVIVLPEWRVQSRLPKALEALHSWQPVRTLPARILRLDLPSSWEDYLAGVSRNRRYMIRSTRRKLEEAGASYFTNGPSEQFSATFDRLAELHRLRWTAKGEAHAFASPEYLAFHREMAGHLLRQGMLRLHGIRIGSEIVAMLYCFRHRDTVYHFQGGFDPALSHLRPGFALYGYAIEQAIDERATAFDMLAGDHEYKERWASTAVELQSREFRRPTIGGHLYSLRYNRMSAMKRWLIAALATAAALLSIDM